MKPIKSILLPAFLSTAFAVALSGCEQEGPAEKAGKKIDTATEQMGEQMEQMGESLSETAEQTGEFIDDAAITAKVKADLVKDASLAALDIDVSTTDGVVTLSGAVDSQESIDKSLEIAGNVEGVKSVTNELLLKTVP